MNIHTACNKDTNSLVFFKENKAWFYAYTFFMHIHKLLSCKKIIVEISHVL